MTASPSQLCRLARSFQRFLAKESPSLRLQHSDHSTIVSPIFFFLFLAPDLARSVIHYIAVRKEVFPLAGANPANDFPPPPPQAARTSLIPRKR